MVEIVRTERCSTCDGEIDGDVCICGLIESIDDLQKEIGRYQQWVNDLQSGMHINCVYCGHRYGPCEETPVSMAEVLKEHIEQCPKHPLSAMKQRAEELAGLLGEVVSFSVSWKGGGYAPHERERRWPKLIKRIRDALRGEEGEGDGSDRASAEAP